MSEQWAPIPSAPGYEASTLGRVRSLDRVVAARAGSTAVRRGRVLRPCNGKNGYKLVTPNRRTMFVHRLVLEAFVGPRPDGHEARHGNGNPADNRLANLRWGTSGENRLDQVVHGTHSLAKRSHCPRGHLLTVPNLRSSHRWRECLACCRARSRYRRLTLAGIESDFKQIADAYYAAILKEES